MKIGLGTVQFGLNYGVANTAGQCTPSEARRILSTAEQYGITCLDTAIAYGNSESLLGQMLKSIGSFKVISKIPSLKHYTRDQLPSALGELIERSLGRLNRDSIHAYLLHDANDLIGENSDVVADTLIRLKATGLFSKIGVSAYSASEIESANKKLPLDIVQVPLNILDQRLLKNSYLKILKARNTEIHVRSIFLQGLLTLPLASVPSYFQPIFPKLNFLHQKAKDMNTSVKHIALSFAQKIHEIDALIMGVDNAAQLEEIYRLHQNPLELTQWVEDIAVDEQEFINPSLWKIEGAKT